MNVLSEKYDIFSRQEDKREDRYMVYFPLSGYLLLGSNELVKNLEIWLRSPNTAHFPGEITRRQSLQLIIDPAEIISDIKKEHSNGYRPTHIFLFPTMNCSLRCLYCYSDGGRKNTNMDRETAWAAVDFAVSNALKTNKKEIKVYFHGGGEPTLHWELLTRVVAYAEKKAHREGLRAAFGLATNGMLNQRKIDFIREKEFEIVSVALDGPPEIQNRQRPGAAENNTFTQVYNTCRAFDRFGFKNYDINITVTQESMKSLGEIVRFMARHFDVHDIHLGPMVSAGRGCDSSLHPPNFKQAVEYFLCALEAAGELNLNVSIPGTDIHNICHTYCGAAGSNCFVAYDGMISTCLEAYDHQHPRGEMFIIGQYRKKTNEFQINTDRVRHLSQRKNVNLEHCAHCFLKWNCAGDCMVRVKEGEEITTGKTSEDRCYFKRTIAIHRMRNLTGDAAPSQTNDNQRDGAAGPALDALRKQLPGMKRIVPIKRANKIFARTITICPGG
jgi:uncharacterized protein